jgi:hypothetical protein
MRCGQGEFELSAFFGIVSLDALQLIRTCSNA